MIYLDHAATTPIDEEVARAMRPYLGYDFGNPSSIHTIGVRARNAIEESRVQIASFLKAAPEEIIFTSGGTEADNMAIKGIAFANRHKGNHIITTKIEHDAVLNSCRFMENIGFKVTYLDVNSDGMVNPQDVRNAMTNKTILVSVMHANNEIGTIELIKDISEICKEKDVYFHTDAVQTFGHIPIDTANINLLSASAHKINGPKGIGFLFIQQGTHISPLIHGGNHEFTFRSGTENVAGIVGFAKAVELREQRMYTESYSPFPDKLIKETSRIPGTIVNGHLTKRLPNNASFCFSWVEGEALIRKFNQQGIAVSTGSACSSKETKPSHVLMAIGRKPHEAHGSLRISLGQGNTSEEIDRLIEILPNTVEELRKLSQLGRQIKCL